MIYYDFCWFYIFLELICNEPLSKWISSYIDFFIIAEDMPLPKISNLFKPYVKSFKLLIPRAETFFHFDITFLICFKTF